MPGSDAGSHGAHEGAPCGRPAAAGITAAATATPTVAASCQLTRYGLCAAAGRTTANSVSGMANRRIQASFQTDGLQLTRHWLRLLGRAHLSWPCGFRPSPLPLGLNFPFLLSGSGDHR